MEEGQQLPGIGDEVLGHMKMLTLTLQQGGSRATKVMLEEIAAPPSEGLYGLGMMRECSPRKRLTIEWDD